MPTLNIPLIVESAQDFHIFFYLRLNKKMCDEPGFPVKEYNKVEELGSGSFGDVERWVNLHTQKTIALKKFKLSAGEDISVDCLREMATLKRVGQHPHVVNMIGVASGDNKAPIMVMENMEDTLDVTIFNHGAGLQVGAAIRIYSMIRDGLQHLHMLGFMHRDLKPQNILCNQCSNPEQCTVMIADMGMACRYIPQRKNTIVVQTLWWRAPEVLLGDAAYTPKIDYWSVGLILLQLVTGKSRLIQGEIVDEDGNIISGREQEANQLNKYRILLGEFTDHLKTLPLWNEDDFETPLSSPLIDKALLRSGCVNTLQQGFKLLLAYNPAERHLPEFEVVQRAPNQANCSLSLRSNAEPTTHMYGMVPPQENLDVENAWSRCMHVNIKMRKILVCWMLEIALQLGFEMYTYQLAVGLLDAYVAGLLLAFTAR